MLAEAVGNALKEGLRGLVELKKGAHEKRIRLDDAEARVCLLEHIGTLERWANTITLASLLKERRLAESFIELGLTMGLVPTGQGRLRPLSLARVLKPPGHLAILGRPGAGKTTTLQRVGQLALAARERGEGGVPLLVRLRELRPGQGLVGHLLTECGLSVTGGSGISKEVRIRWERRILERFVSDINAVLLLDGLDEIDVRMRASVEDEIASLSLSRGKHRIVLTCRSAEYQRPFLGMRPYTLLPLTKTQVERFAAKWLGTRRAKDFMQAIVANPYAGSEVMPLTLAHLCAIFERDGELPPRPIEVYETIVSLLVEEWDRQRGVRRQSKYAGFTWRKKERFLQGVAFALTKTGRRGTFHHRDLYNAYEQLALEFNLPLGDAGLVLREIESHTGLIQLSGHRQYDWVHLSIQEYLGAMYTARLPNAAKVLVPLLPNEMALVIANSSDANDSLEAVLQVAIPLPADRAVGFLRPFLSRLSLERPAFRQNPRLGWVLLALLDRAAVRVGGVSRPGEFAAEELRIFADSQVQTSMHLAMLEGATYPETHGYRIVPLPHATMPPWLSEVLADKNRHSGLVVPLDVGISPKISA